VKDYQVDKLGYPLDPKMRELQNQLSAFAANWRGEPERKEEIKSTYHATMSKLYSMG